MPLLYPSCNRSPFIVWLPQVSLNAGGGEGGSADTATGHHDVLSNGWDGSVWEIQTARRRRQKLFPWSFQRGFQHHIFQPVSVFMAKPMTMLKHFYD